MEAAIDTTKAAAMTDAALRRRFMAPSPLATERLYFTAVDEPGPKNRAIEAGNWKRY
jgi:hypothetical protein